MKHGIGFVREELADFSSRFSNGVRVLALGIIAATWAIFSTDSIRIPDQMFGLDSSLMLKGAFFLTALTLSLDLLQYYLGYQVHSIAHRFMQSSEGNAEFEYSRETLGSFGYAISKCGRCLIHLKFAVLILAAISFCVLSLGIEKAPIK